MRLTRAVVLALTALVFAAAPARADWLFTPFVGANFGGDTIDTSAAYGASFGFMGAGIFGLEADFSYAPNFYQNEPTFDGNVTSLMGNVIIGAPIGGSGGSVRPYASGGIGLLRSRVDDASGFFEDISNNSLGMNVGGGVMGFFNDHVGLRGDIRYFRSLQDAGDNEGVDLGDVELGKFDFWRGSVGVTFRF
jgi:opacity protein-like surface antigen